MRGGRRRQAQEQEQELSSAPKQGAGHVSPGKKSGRIPSLEPFTKRLVEDGKLRNQSKKGA